tara:strand:- start:3217 stop:5151 length:1935 start_codon:yes stop_codon:yes gene_type:complete
LSSVEIPGIGTVFADGFAQESTLQSLLQVMSQQQSGGSGDPTTVLKSQSSAAGRVIASLGSQAKSAGDNVNEGGESAYQGLTLAGRSGRTFSDNIGRASGNLFRSFETASTAPFAMAKALTVAATKMVDGAGGFGKLLGGGALGAAVGNFSSKLTGMSEEMSTIGGGLLGAVAPGLVAGGAAAVAGFLFDKLNATSAAFDAVQAGGATLGGSLIEFRQAAHNGYLTMGEFTNVMKNNGEAMASFGGQTAVGAKEFSKANRALAGGDMGRQLKQMGFTFEDMGSTTADMMEQFTLSGMSFDQLAVRTSEVAKASFEQARQQKILSALTGRSIEAQKQAEKAQRKDAQVQASLARMGPEQRKQTEQLISAFPHLKDAILDQVTFGGAVSKEAMMQLSQFPNAVASVQGAVDGIKDGSGIAIDAFTEQAKNSEAIREEYLNAADMVATLGRFTSNAFVKSAESMIVPQQEMMAKAIGDTVSKVVDDMQRIASGGDAATNALIEQQKAQRELGMEISKTTTKLLSESDGLIEGVTTLTKGATFLVDKLNQGIGAPKNTVEPGQTRNGNTKPPSTPAAGQSMGFFTGIGQGVDNFLGNDTISDPAATATQSGTAGNTVPVDMSSTDNILAEMLKQQKIAARQLQIIATQ